MSFELWIEFEEYGGSDNDDGFFNATVALEDGRRYALNVWTFDYLAEARTNGSAYVLTPDLLLESATREALADALRSILSQHDFPEHWLVEHDERQSAQCPAHDG